MPIEDRDEATDTAQQSKRMDEKRIRIGKCLGDSYASPQVICLNKTIAQSLRGTLG